MVPFAAGANGHPVAGNLAEGVFGIKIIKIKKLARGLNRLSELKFAYLLSYFVGLSSGWVRKESFASGLFNCSSRISSSVSM